MNEVKGKDVLSQWRLIIVSVIIFALVAMTISLMLPAKYKSETSMIVIQKQSTEKIDAFSATKSAEFLSNVFTKIIYTTSFFSAVQDAPFNVERDFSQDPEKREKQWERMVEVKKANNTSIIKISVLNTSRKTAEETSKAIAYTLTTKSDEYHGGGDRVEVRLIDGPNTPLRPTVPNILYNTIFGGLIGFVVAVILAYFFPQKIWLVGKSDYKKQNIVLSDNSKVEEYVQEADGDIDAAEDYEDEINVEERFKNTHGSIEFDQSDDELNELHARISTFNTNSSN